MERPSATGAPRADEPQRPRRARRNRRAAYERELCPKCGLPGARIIGRSEAFPVLYLRCDECEQTSIAPA